MRLIVQSVFTSMPCLQPMTPTAFTDTPCPMSAPRRSVRSAHASLRLLLCFVAVFAAPSGSLAASLSLSGSPRAIPPPDPPRELKALVGEYSSGNDRLTVYEAEGRLL